MTGEGVQRYYYLQDEHAAGVTDAIELFIPPSSSLYFSSWHAG